MSCGYFQKNCRGAYGIASPLDFVAVGTGGKEKSKGKAETNLGSAGWTARATCRVRRRIV